MLFACVFNINFNFVKNIYVGNFRFEFLHVIQLVKGISKLKNFYLGYFFRKETVSQLELTLWCTWAVIVRWIESRFVHRDFCFCQSFWVIWLVLLIFNVLLLFVSLIVYVWNLNMFGFQIVSFCLVLNYFEQTKVSEIQTDCLDIRHHFVCLIHNTSSSNITNCLF